MERRVGVFCYSIAWANELFHRASGKMVELIALIWLMKYVFAAVLLCFLGKMVDKSEVCL